MENQRHYRHSLESQQVAGAERRQNRSQLFGFTIALLGILLSTMAHIYTGTYVFPLGLAFVTIGGPATAQLLAREWIGKKRQKRENKD